MGRFLILIAISLGGACGWGLGQFAGLVPGFFMAVLGAAIGAYLARKYLRDHLP